MLTLSFPVRLPVYPVYPVYADFPDLVFVIRHLLASIDDSVLGLLSRRAELTRSLRNSVKIINLNFEFKKS